MAIKSHPIRDKHLVWRDIGGQIVIAEKDNKTVRLLNKTASLIWTLADGTRQTDDIIIEVCNKYNVGEEQARADVEKFCQQMLEVGLISMKDLSQKS